MTGTDARRVIHEATPEQVEFIDRMASLIDREKPEIIERLRLLEQAADNPGFCGELRRAVHSSAWSIDRIAKQTGIEAFRLCDFLEGTAELTSGEIEKLARELGLKLVLAIPSSPPGARNRPNPLPSQQGSAGCKTQDSASPSPD